MHSEIAYIRATYSYRRSTGMSGPRAKIGQKSSGKSTSPATDVRVWSFGWGPSVFLFFVCLFLFFFFSDPQIIPTRASLSLKGNKRRETLVTRLKLMLRRGLSQYHPVCLDSIWRSICFESEVCIFFRFKLCLFFFLNWNRDYSQRSLPGLLRKQRCTRSSPIT